MLKVFATQVVISKGYDNTPAISIPRGNDSAASVRFRIGKKVYDPKADNNARWLNYSVKGFGPIVNRIEKMQLKEGSFVNIMGRLDEDSWVDKESNETKSCTVIILDEIEYASGGGKSNKATRRTAQAIRHLLKLLQPIPVIMAVVSPAMNLLAAIRSLMIRIKGANK